MPPRLHGTNSDGRLQVGQQAGDAWQYELRILTDLADTVEDLRVMRTGRSHDWDVSVEIRTHLNWKADLGRGVQDRVQEPGADSAAR